MMTPAKVAAAGLKGRPRDCESDQPRFRRAALGADLDAQTHVAQGFAQGIRCGRLLLVSAVFSPQVSPEVSPARARALVDPHRRAGIVSVTMRTIVAALVLATASLAGA